MKNRDLNKLAKEVHENAVKNGFWDNKPSTKHCLMMVITELSEAVQADRKGKRADMEDFNDEMVDEDDKVGFDIAFGWWVKDTVEDELADVYLRLLDIAGKEEINLNSNDVTLNILPKENTFTENMYAVVRYLTSDRFSLHGKVLYSMCQIKEIAERMNIDLLRHVELKMKYNQTREYKHGKRY